MQLQWLPAVGPLGLCPDLDQQQGVLCYAWCQQMCGAVQRLHVNRRDIVSDRLHACHRTTRYLLLIELSKRLLLVHSNYPFICDKGLVRDRVHT